MVIWIVRAFWLVYKRVFIASRYEARKWREQYSLAASKLWDLRLDLQQFFFIISKHVPFKTFTNAHALEIYVPQKIKIVIKIQSRILVAYQKQK